MPNASTSLDMTENRTDATTLKSENYFGEALGALAAGETFAPDEF